MLGSGSRDYYLNDEYKKQIEALKKYLVNLVNILAGDLNYTNVNMKDIDDVMTFEKRLANITVREEDRQNYTLMYNPMTMSELAATLPTVLFTVCLKILLHIVHFSLIYRLIGSYYLK